MTGVRAGLVFLAVVQGLAGVVQLFLPQVFYDDFPGVSLLPPYSEHLMRDVGALTLAYVLMLTVAAVSRSGSCPTPSSRRAPCGVAGDRHRCLVIQESPPAPGLPNSSRVAATVEDNRFHSPVLLVIFAPLSVRRYRRLSN
jgi:hypothetical protein